MCVLWTSPSKMALEIVGPESLDFTANNDS